MKKAILFFLLLFFFAQGVEGALKLNPVQSWQGFLSFCQIGSTYYGTHGDAILSLNPTTATQPTTGFDFDAIDFIDINGTAGNKADDLLGADAANENIDIKAIHLTPDGALLVVGEVNGGDYDHHSFLFRAESPFNAWTCVCSLGDVDGSLANKQDYTWTLYGFSICNITVAVPGGAGGLAIGDILIGEYNTDAVRVDGSTGDQVRLIKSADDGTTWTEVTHWNTDGSTHQTDHIHCVGQDPNTGYIYIGFGDEDVGNEVGIIRWDGVTAITANKRPGDQYTGDGALGITAAAGSEQKYRPINFVFTDNYIHWMSDTPTAGEQGIYRIANTVAFADANVERVYTYTDASLHGWSGAALGDVVVFTDNPDPSQYNLDAINVYSSGNEGANYAKVGILPCQDVQDAAGKVFCWASWSDGTNILLANPYSVGVKTGNGTAVVQPGGEFTDLDGYYDILHPVRWVSTSGTDSVADDCWGKGWTSGSNAWRTLAYALQGDRIANGFRIIVEAGAYVTDATCNPDWDAHGNTKEGGDTGYIYTVIEGAGRDNTSITRAGASTGFMYSIEDADETIQEEKIVFKGISFADHVDNDQGKMFRIYGDGDVEFYDCTVTSIEDVAANVMHISGDFKFERSSLICPLSPTNIVLPISTATTAGPVVRINNSIIYGGTRSYSDTVASTDTAIYHSDLISPSAIGINIAATASNPPTIIAKNNIFYCDLAGSQAYNDGATWAEADANFDYNFTYGSWNTGYDADGAAPFDNPPGSHSIDTKGGSGNVPGFKGVSDYRLNHNSPCIDAGANVTGLHPTTDYRGRISPWPKGGTPDIGAYEAKRPEENYPGNIFRMRAYQP